MGIGLSKLPGSSRAHWVLGSLPGGSQETRVAGRAELGFTCPQLAVAFVGGRAASGLGVHLHLEERTESLGSSPTAQPGLVKPVTQAIDPVFR